VLGWQNGVSYGVFMHHTRATSGVAGPGLCVVYIRDEKFNPALPWGHKSLCNPLLLASPIQVYKNFIEAVDAIDNGIGQYEAAGAPRYVSNTSLGSRVGQLNPNWNEEQNNGILDACFLKAVALTGGEFKEAVEYVAKVWLPAKLHVKAALSAMASVDPSCQIMRLVTVCPWKDHLYELEKEMALEKPVLFCVFEDTREKKWRIQAVSESASSFKNRRNMPAAWCGLRDAKLSEASGIPGCVFCHANGFIGGNDSYEGVLKMAQLSLTME
jgi:uncharacterized UPF0160 family protein